MKHIINSVNQVCVPALKLSLQEKNLCTQTHTHVPPSCQKSSLPRTPFHELLSDFYLFIYFSFLLRWRLMKWFKADLSRCGASSQMHMPGTIWRAFRWMIFHHAGCAKGRAHRDAYNTSSETTRLGRAGRHNYEQLPSWPPICQPIKLDNDYHMSDKLLKVILYSLCFFPSYCLAFSFLCFFYLFILLYLNFSSALFLTDISLFISPPCALSFLPRKGLPNNPLHLKFGVEMSRDSWFYQSKPYPLSATLNYWLLEVCFFLSCQNG